MRVRRRKDAEPPERPGPIDDLAEQLEREQREKLASGRQVFTTINDDDEQTEHEEPDDDA